MGAFKSASIRLRTAGLRLGTTQIFSMKPKLSNCCCSVNYVAQVIQPQDIQMDELGCTGRRFYRTSFSQLKSYTEVRRFSSEDACKISNEQDENSSDTLSEFETVDSAAHIAGSGKEVNDDSISKSELSGDDDIAAMQNELDPISTKGDGEKKILLNSRVIPAITKAVIGAHVPSSVREVLDKWVEEGNEVNQIEVSFTMLHLHRQRMYAKALQLLDWLESSNHLKVLESTYASRVDLKAKVEGIFKAEEYLHQIPESFRGELVYRTLLVNCVSVTNVKKSEEIFYKMKDLFPVTAFSCNLMLLLYKRINKKKILSVLELMEKENIKPSHFTYQILIYVKALSRDFDGMEKILEKMKSEGVEANAQIQISLARHYVAARLNDKAMAVLKELERDDLKKNRWVCRFLLPLYASLGREDDVERIWKICKSNELQLGECMAAITAWGQLKRIENAEAAFEEIVRRVEEPEPRHYAALINVYTNHKMLDKGKDFVNRMAETGRKAGPLTWDALVNLYIQAGEVEKANSVLENASKMGMGKPLYTSFFATLDWYAKRGDIHNAEKVFLMMKKAQYTSRIHPYRLLLQAYINAKVPAYGFRERMKVDGVIPHRTFSKLLREADPFRKSAMAESLDPGKLDGFLGKSF